MFNVHTCQLCLSNAYSFLKIQLKTLWILTLLWTSHRLSHSLLVEWVFFSFVQLIFFFFFCLGLSRWCRKEFIWQCSRHRSRVFDPWVGKIPWSRKWQPTPGFLPEKSHGQRSLGYSYSPCSCSIRHSWAHTHTLQAYISASLIPYYISISLM